MRIVMRIFLILVLAFIVPNYSTSFIAAAASDDPNGSSGLAAPRTVEELWREIKEIDGEDFRRDNLKIYSEIYALASKRNLKSDALKAVMKKILIEDSLGGARNIDLLEAEIEKADRSLKPVMKIILAEWYLNFLDGLTEHDWRMSEYGNERAAGDYRAWKPSEFVKKIYSLCDDALADEDYLYKIPISEYSDFIENKGMPESVCPALLDFLAYKAVEICLQLDRHNIADKVCMSKVKIEARAIRPAAEFLKYEPRLIETGEVDSNKSKIIQYYQKMIRARLYEKSSDALAYADLGRTGYLFYESDDTGGDKFSLLYRPNNGKNSAMIKEYAGSGDLLLDALNERAALYSASMVSSRAYFWMSGVRRTQKRTAEALALAEKGEKLHPGTVWARACGKLAEEIKAPSIEIYADKVFTSGPGAALKIVHKNIDRVYFRAVRENYRDYREFGIYEKRPFIGSREALEAAVAAGPAAEWQVDLKRPADYEATEEVAAIPELPRGFYRILAGAKKDFSTAENQILYALIWISDIEVVFRYDRGADKQMTGTVTGREGGEPIAGASVMFRSDSSMHSKGTFETLTDREGKFYIDDVNKICYGKASAVVTTGSGDELALCGIELANDRAIYAGAPKASTQTILFCDRPIYRPGQQINFKGVCVNADQKAGIYGVAAGLSVEVELGVRKYHGYEARDIVVDKVEAAAGEFGSFSGSFRAPSNEPGGEYFIRTRSPEGIVHFSVEEYKRPSFTVKIDVPRLPFAYYDDIEFTGEVTALNGAPSPGAAVRYRVFAMPYWWELSCPQSDGSFMREIMEIASGTTEAGAGGTFEIKFAARPHSKKSRFDGNDVVADVTTYKVMVDAVSGSGETVSAIKSFYIGKEPVYALLSGPKWNDSNETVELTITSETYNGLAAEVEGTLEIYELAQPAKIEAEDDRPYKKYYFNDDDYNDFDDSIGIYEERFEARMKERAPKPAQAFEFWPVRASVFSVSCITGADGAARVRTRLKPGAYRAVFEGYSGARGTKVKTYLPFIVVDGARGISCVKTPLLLLADRGEAAAGETVKFLCCSGYEKCNISIELISGGKTLKSYKVAGDAPQSFIDIPVAGEYAAGFSLVASLKKNGKIHMASAYVKVRDESKKLSVKLSSFKETAAPGGEETWTLKVKGPEGGGQGTYEIGATLYDAALDAMAEYKKPSFDGLFYKVPAPTTAYKYSNYPIGFLLCHDSLSGHSDPDQDLDRVDTPDYTGEIKLGSYGSSIGGLAEMNSISGDRAVPQTWQATDIGAENERECSDFRFLYHDRRQAIFQKCSFAEKLKRIAGFGYIMRTKGISDDKPFAAAGGPAVDFASISARSNFNELAFFLPHVTTGPGGTAEINFTMPEQLTKWRFRGFAHGKNLESGSCEAEVFTRKPFMLITNPPRFIRNSDEIEFPAVIENAGGENLEGEAVLELETDGCSCEFAGDKPDKKFSVPAGGAVTIYWRISVSGGPGALRFKCAARAGRFDDGEAGSVPVLSSVEALYDVVSISSREKGKRKYRFEKIAEICGAGERGAPDSCELTVRVMPSPMWYVVSALPYLMVFPHECCEQTFNKLYANAVAKKLNESIPSIRKAFETYRRSCGGRARGTFAGDERLGALADFYIDDLFESQIKKAYDKLSAAIAPNGFWPWFEGGRISIDMTLYIMTGFGRLRKMKAGGFEPELAEKCMRACDKWFLEGLDSLEAVLAGRENDFSAEDDGRRMTVKRLSAYIYGRSNYLDDSKPTAGLEKTIKSAMAILKKEWKNIGNRLTLARIALGFWRFGEKEEAAAVMNAIKKNGLEHKSPNFDFGWYDGGVESASAAVEGFVEILNDSESADDYRAFIISRFINSNWLTTTASADAVYALLLCGEALPAAENSIEVNLGASTVKLGSSGIWPGYFEKSFRGAEIKPRFADLIVDNPFGKMMFGEAGLKYYRDISKIKAPGGGAVEIKKSIAVRRGPGGNSPGEAPANAKISPGDVLTVRLEINSKNALRYVSIEDGRPCGCEPAGIVSQYKYAGGLNYYVTGADTSTRFYIEYLPAGRHTIEYDLYAVHKGRFNSGPAFLECMYSPEFKSHSESVAVEVTGR